MFTIEQINDTHDRYGKASTLPDYLRALKDIGVEYYDSYITDGHSEYFGGGAKVISPPAHETFPVADTSDKQRFLGHVEAHKQGKTDYFQMSQGLAASGVEKWRFNTNAMTLTYFDKTGAVLLTEKIA